MSARRWVWLAAAPLMAAACGSSGESTSSSANSGGSAGGGAEAGSTAGTSVGGGGSSFGGVGGGGAGGAGATGGTGGTGATGAMGGTAGSPGLGPPYPVVLAHGFFGFEEFAGIGFIDYFFQVKDDLAAAGEPMVFTPAVDPFNNSTLRGAQLEQHVADILATTGYAKVNIIGHSQGGLDARVVAHNHPEWVASVLTVATPHNGTPVADALLGIVPNQNLQNLIDWFVKLIARPLYDAAGNETSIIEPMKQFSTPGIAAFNAEYTDGPGVAYFSIGGRSDRHPGGSNCVAPNAPPFVSAYNLALDPIDPLLNATEIYLTGGFNLAPNDGLVRVADSKWGTFLGCIPADHFDEIGHLFGDIPGLINPFRHKPFYRDLVKFLRAKGH